MKTQFSQPWVYQRSNWFKKYGEVRTPTITETIERNITETFLFVPQTVCIVCIFGGYGCPYIVAFFQMVSGPSFQVRPLDFLESLINVINTCVKQIFLHVRTSRNPFPQAPSGVWHASSMCKSRGLRGSVFLAVPLRFQRMRAFLAFLWPAMEERSEERLGL